MKTGLAISAMIDYLNGNLHEVEHLLKVYGYAKAIGEMEGLDARTQEILEIAAVVHDIGIPSETILIVQSIIIFFMAAERGISASVRERRVRRNARIKADAAKGGGEHA